MINNNKSILKEGFSLVEMLLLLMIASLITAGSMSVITKKHSRVPKKIVHGKYTCYRTSDGKLMEERYVEKARLYKREVAECKLKPPAKASYFYIQLVGGGGAGGDAGYDGNTRNSVNESGTKTAYGWTESEINGSPFYMTLSDWQGFVAGDVVYACATSGSGGDGSGAGKSYLGTTGKCRCGSNETAGMTEADCTAMSTEAVSCSWSAEVLDTTVSGGSGGSSATCNTGSVPVGLGLKHEATNDSGSNGRDYSSSIYINDGLSGGDGGDATAKISQNGSIVASCTAYGGTGGSPATRTPCSDYSFCYDATAGTDGTDGSCSGTCDSSCSAGEHSPSYSWSHEYDTKYMTAGEGGTAGEYLAIFVRSFQSNTVDLKPGRGGAAPALGSGDDGNPGEETSMSNGALSVPGGLGGKGKQPLPVKILPPAPGYPSEAEDSANTHTGISPNHIGSISTYERAANVTNMNDVPPTSGEGIDLNTFGRGGNGGTSQDNCWISTHIRKFAGNTLSSSYPGPISCSDTSYTNVAATAGAPGSIVIIW